MVDIKTVEHNKISAIVPTIGRLSSLQELFDSIVKQTHCVHEVIVADGSASPKIENFVIEFSNKYPQICFSYLSVQPPNAVYQRQKAIEVANGDLLLLVDDDIVLEVDCLKNMQNTMNDSSGVVAVCAMLQGGWSKPTRLWSWYLKYVTKLQPGEWQGRVVGPLLRFGYNPSPIVDQEMQWLGTGNSLIKRSAFEAAGGFSEFFLHRCTMNEDVDLGIKLSQHGKLLLSAKAYMIHHHAPSGRVTAMLAAEDDLYNRFLVFKNTLRYSTTKAWQLVFTFLFIESISDFYFAAKSFSWKHFLAKAFGRVRATFRIIKLAISL